MSFSKITPVTHEVPMQGIETNSQGEPSPVTLDELPELCLQTIFTIVSAKDQASLTGVCRRFRDVTNGTVFDLQAMDEKTGLLSRFLPVPRCNLSESAEEKFVRRFFAASNKLIPPCLLRFKLVFPWTFFCQTNERSHRFYKQYMNSICPSLLVIW